MKKHQSKISVLILSMSVVISWSVPADSDGGIAPITGSTVTNPPPSGRSPATPQSASSIAPVSAISPAISPSGPPQPGTAYSGPTPTSPGNLLSTHQNTGDIASAAQDMSTHFGDRITWSNDGNIAEISSVDEMMSQTLMSCFEFVDFVAWMAGPQATMSSGNPRVAFSKGSIIEYGTDQEWDGHSNIPRGKIVCGWARFPVGDWTHTRGNYYHVGISLGDGWIISNRGGSNITIEHTGDCFGIGYGEVRFGDYNWRGQQQVDPPNSNHEEEVDNRQSMNWPNLNPFPAPFQTTLYMDPIGLELAMNPGVNIDAILDASSRGGQRFNFTNRIHEF